ncbi:MAG: polyketide synthase, partial [Oligoflexales bacterium]|nr:polyketide synthase [Oligoflexales bacterium]
MGNLKYDMENDIAVIGMACIYPGAGDIDQFWNNIKNGFDAIIDAPENRIDPLFRSDDPKTPEKIYCSRGGFIDEFATFDPVRFGIIPNAIENSEPDQLLSLKTAAKAFEHAGYDDLSHHKIGVIVGRGQYVSANVARFSSRISFSEHLVVFLKSIIPAISEKAMGRIKDEFTSQIGHFQPEAGVGFMPSLTAARIANRLNLTGPAYTLDAACASSLVAVTNACQLLRKGICDMVLSGGVHIGMGVEFWAVFSLMRIISPSKMARPLDRRADGLLVGEGTGFLVLRRLADAIRDGNEIYAVIKGASVTSDGRELSILKPLAKGQMDALSQAWKMTDINPETIGLLEAHSPGTPEGDKSELKSSADFFGQPAKGSERAVIGSVKSMIGHTMPAAGAAGLIKTIMSIYHGVLPPTINCEEPNPLLDSSRFRTISKQEEWRKPTCERIAGVNAFGFGGINSHIILQGYENEGTSRKASGNILGALPGNTPGRLSREVKLNMGFSLSTLDFSKIRSIIQETISGDKAGTLSYPEIPTDSPVLSAFNENIHAAMKMQKEVLDSYMSRKSLLKDSCFRENGALKKESPKTGSEIKWKEEMSLDRFPVLRDHNLSWLPPNWPKLEDSFTVVPMTMIFEFFISAARKIIPDMKVLAIENIKAHKWICVATPIEVEFVIERLDFSKVKVNIL